MNALLAVTVLFAVFMSTEGVYAAEPHQISSRAQVHVITQLEFKASQDAERTPEECMRVVESKMGDRGENVEAIQRCFLALGYRIDKIDGRYGAATASITALHQKRVGIIKPAIVGLDGVIHPSSAKDRRGAGIVGPATVRSLRVAKPVTMPAGCLREDTTCVVLRQQVLYARDGRRVVATNTSSGNGEKYKKPGSTVEEQAITQQGHAMIFRKVEGPDYGPLGVMYSPNYLRYKGADTGIAVHGSDSVPVTPASHGCMRVTHADEVWVFKILYKGARITVLW